MTEQSEVPHGYTGEHEEYLDELRESAEVNMLLAYQNLQEDFGLSKAVAQTYAKHWRDNFTGEEE